MPNNLSAGISQIISSAIDDLSRRSQSIDKRDLVGAVRAEARRIKSSKLSERHRQAAEALLKIHRVSKSQFNGLLVDELKARKKGHNDSKLIHRKKESDSLHDLLLSNAKILSPSNRTLLGKLATDWERRCPSIKGRQSDASEGILILWYLHNEMCRALGDIALQDGLTEGLNQYEKLLSLTERFFDKHSPECLLEQKFSFEDRLIFCDIVNARKSDCGTLASSKLNAQHRWGQTRRDPPVLLRPNEEERTRIESFVKRWEALHEKINKTLPKEHRIATTTPES